jgi:hypothetical protein
MFFIYVMYPCEHVHGFAYIVSLSSFVCEYVCVHSYVCVCVCDNNNS